MNTCIYCNANDDLNSQFTITLDDGEKVTVLICDAHAEDATIRTAKERYLDKQRQIDALMEQARALGLEISQPSKSGLVTVTKKSEKPKPEPATPISAQVVEVEEGMVDTIILDQRDGKGMVSVSGVAAGQSIESHRSLNLQEVKGQLPEDALIGKVKVEIVEGRGGTPLAMPTKRIDGTGTTQIRVVPTTDAQIQKRFKSLADQSKSAHGWDGMHHFGKEGYDIHDCPICQGAGETKNAGKTIKCPKCNGAGMLN